MSPAPTRRGFFFAEGISDASRGEPELHSAILVPQQIVRELSDPTARAARTPKSVQKLQMATIVSVSQNAKRRL